MKTGPARRLWMGFGALIALLVVSSVVIVWRLFSIDDEVRGMADARNLGAAAADLEVDALAYVLHVGTYLHTRDEKALALSREARFGVNEHLREYRQLTNRDGRHELGSRFEPVWQEVVSLGEGLVASEPRGVSPDQSRHFFELQRNLRDVLRNQIRQDALGVYNARKDHALRDVQNVIRLTLIMIVAGSAIGVMVSVAMTRRIVHTERRLVAQRKLLQVTLASIADAVITSDRNGVITSLNEVASELTGWQPGDALSKPLTEVYRIHRAASMIPGDSVLDETSLVTRGGRTIPIDESTSAIRDENGVAAGLVVVFRDATHRRRLEQNLREEAATLAQSNQNKNEFLAMLAHELRNPLAPIRSGAAILRRQTESLPTLKPAVTMIERQVGQLVRLVDDLVDMTRISRGKIELRKRPTDVQAALRMAMEEVEPLFESSRHDVQLRLAPRPVIVLADPERLTQMFGNLLHNAAKFTPTHGRIEVDVTATPSEAIVRIRDTGVGISSEHLPHVFDLYMQSGTSLQRSGSGVGIGLALVKAIGELHGGSVLAHSQGLDQGSTFIVCLPLTEETVTTPVPTKPHALAPMRILVVDDNSDAAESLAILLRADGHDVQTATDGVTALDRISTSPPQAVILDLGLPGMDGFQIARAIRASVWGGSMRLIALTGWGQPENLARTKAAGFDGHLVKPAALGALNDLLSVQSSDRVVSPTEAEVPPTSMKDQMAPACEEAATMGTR